MQVVLGDPALTMLNISCRRTIDLVAIGTQGRNAIARHLLGSVAREVLVGATCDILIAPASS